MSDPDAFLKKAKSSVAITEGGLLTEKNLYIVWFCKVLGNWKALISTDVVSGHYWEVTYNGLREETYVDKYIKGSNSVITDAP
jgi:hypothetical protein